MAETTTFQAAAYTAQGAERHTQTHLRVEKIDAERNLIYVRGAVAGPRNGIVLVRKQG